MLSAVMLWYVIERWVVSGVLLWYVTEMRVSIPKSLDNSDPSSFLSLDLGLDKAIYIFKVSISISIKGLELSKSRSRS